MKHTIKIVILSLCAALALSSCNKRHHTPDTTDQKILIGFTPLSQDAAVKALADNNLANYHQDFGVWGIASQNNISNPTPYILWNQTTMARVVAVEDESSTAENKDYTGAFSPVTPAYWLANNTYNFVAVAPFEVVDPTKNTSALVNSNTKTLTFTYNIASKYIAGTYDFDLLGAVASQEVKIDKPTSQELNFWHLLTKLSIKVEFVGTIGEVTAMRLQNIDATAAYTITEDSDGISVVCTSVSDGEGEQQNVTLTPSKNVIHLLPQDISDFELYLDFEIGEGDNKVSTSNFKCILDKAKENPYYKYNEQYNWIIKISPKTIDFDVKVTPWGEGGSFDFDIQ